MPAATEGKNGIIAAILSLLIPGVGQFYVGQIGKGFMFIILWLVAWGIAASIMGLFVVWPAFIILPIWAAIDGYKATK